MVSKQTQYQEAIVQKIIIPEDKLFLQGFNPILYFILNLNRAKVNIITWTAEKY